jgi:hypothetical protein
VLSFFVLLTKEALHSYSRDVFLRSSERQRSRLCPADEGSISLFIPVMRFFVPQKDKRCGFVLLTEEA